MVGVEESVYTRDIKRSLEYSMSMVYSGGK
jgi:hypothetical protein